MPGSKKIKLLFVFLTFSGIFLHFSSAFGSDDNVQHFAKYSVHYTVFNSTFLQPEVAAAYKLKRSEYESLINVSVVKTGEYGGLPVTISGTVTDLMQQQKALQFQEIREDSVVYYLAPVRIAGEDTVHFDISVTPEGESEPLVTTFTQKIYSD